MSCRSSDSSASSEHAENAYCIFMHIVEGVGLQRSKGQRATGTKRNHEHILLLVSLNNVKFEIEGHSTETVTIFNSNCIWECGLDDIRRMKTDNRPVRIECFLNNGTTNSSPLKLIGTLLLPIRGLPTLSTLRNYQPKFLWHKLGSLCADWRPFKPELNLLLIVAKKSLVENENFESLLEKRQAPTSLSSRTTETSSMLQSQSNVYVQLLEQVGLIQVGNNPEVDCDIYQVTVTLKRVKDLATLLEVDNCQTEKNSFVFSYELLGKSSHLEIVVDPVDSYALNNKIALKFKSSPKSLKLYFQRIFYIPINIYYNGHAVANYRFDCSKFLPEDSYFEANRFWDKNGSFYFDRLHKLLSPRAKKPSVEFCFSMQLVEAHFKKSSKEVAVFGSYFSARTLDDEGAGGDNMIGTLTEYERQNCHQTATARPDTELSPSLNKSYNRTNSEPALKYSKLQRMLQSAAFKACRDIGNDTRDLPQSEHADACIGNDESIIQIAVAVNTEAHELDDADDEAAAAATKPEETVDTLTMKAVEELEAWKAQQMNDFLEKLDRKEQLYLQMLESNWKKEQTTLQGLLNAKNNECIKLKAQLEGSNMALQALKNDDNTMKIHQLETDVKRLETELRQQQRKTVAKQQDIQDKHHDEKAKLQNENFVLKKNITQLEQRIFTLGKTHFPADQLKEMIVDLREQTARFAEVERLKIFFEEKYTATARELKKLKLNALKQKEKKLQSRLNRDGYSSQDISHDEAEAPASHRASPKVKPKKSIREMLLKQSDTSDTCDIDMEET